MKTRHILLPKKGVRASQGARDMLIRADGAVGSDQSIRLSNTSSSRIKVVDGVIADGPKLVEVEPSELHEFNRPDFPLRLVPEVIFRHPRPFPHTPGVIQQAQPTALATAFSVQCVDSASGAPLASQEVLAFDNFTARTGDKGTTDANGHVQLRISGNTIDRLFVQSSDTHWGHHRERVPVSANLRIPLTRLSSSYSDAIRTLYPSPRFNKTTGVVVGVLDTGMGPHVDLNVIGGACTVTGEPSTNFADINIHGTHVGGLIGGTGGMGLATRGLSPGVPLRGYRVFGFNGGYLGASNYAILKAMILAAQDGCDIVNLSLGGGPADPIVEEAILDAREQGMLVVIAAGNDGRAPVGYPAAHLGATAVSAMGRDNGFPQDCYFTADILRPPAGTDPNDFLAGFSNIGPEVAATGIGCGVLSTLPLNTYGPLSGTSMAAPMVAGAIASLLSQNPNIYSMPRNRSRSDAIERLLLTSCIKRFGGGNWEGFGLPDPARV